MKKRKGPDDPNDWWTDQDEEMLWELHCEGWKHIALAQRFGRPVASISLRLHALSEQKASNKRAKVAEQLATQRAAQKAAQLANKATESSSSSSILSPPLFEKKKSIKPSPLVRLPVPTDLVVSTESEDAFREAVLAYFRIYRLLLNDLVILILNYWAPTLPYSLESLSPDQLSVVEAIQNGKSTFFTGAA